MSNTLSFLPSLKYPCSSVSFSIPVALNGSSASANTTHPLIVVAKFFPLNGPSGTYSHACTSLALQSFNSTYPNTHSSASSTPTALPISLPLPTKHPSSNSKSIFLLAVVTTSPSTSTCPTGRRTLLPDTTTLDARP